MTIRRLNNKKTFVMPVVEEVNIVPCDVIATSGDVFVHELSANGMGCSCKCFIISNTDVTGGSARWYRGSCLLGGNHPGSPCQPL